jgi:hypothetical protein
LKIRLGLLVLGIMVLSAAGCQRNEEEEPRIRAPRQIFSDLTYSCNPLIRCDRQGDLYLAWREKINDDYSFRVFFCTSRNQGERWSTVLNISRSAYDARDMDLAVDDLGHVFITWFEFHPEEPEGYNVYFCRSWDHGVTWGAPTKMNQGQERASHPALAIDSRGDVLLAWYRLDDNGVIGMRLASSPDLGSTWDYRDFAASPPLHVAQEGGQPFLAAGEDGRLCLLSGTAFQSPVDYGFVCYASLDDGDTWQTQEVHTQAGSMPFHTYPSARFASGDRLVAAWGRILTVGHNSNYWNYFMRRESSGGWSAIQLLSDYDVSRDAKVGLAVAGDKVDVVLARESGLWLLRSNDAGGSWSQPESVSASGRPLFFYSPDMSRGPSGRTFLVAVGSSTGFHSKGSLYLAKFE